MGLLNFFGGNKTEQKPANVIGKDLSSEDRNAINKSFLNKSSQGARDAAALRRSGNPDSEIGEEATKVIEDTEAVNVSFGDEKTPPILDPIIKTEKGFQRLSEINAKLINDTSAKLDIVKNNIGNLISEDVSPKSTEWRTNRDALNMMLEKIAKLNDEEVGGLKTEIEEAIKTIDSSIGNPDKKVA